MRTDGFANGHKQMVVGKMRGSHRGMVDERERTKNLAFQGHRVKPPTQQQFQFTPGHLFITVGPMKKL